MYLTHHVLAPACLLRYTNTEFSLSLSDVNTLHHQSILPSCIASWLYLTLSGPHSESQQFPHILILLRSRTETIQEPPMKLAFFNFKFGTKWTDYWLRELEERGNAQKRTFAILLYIYSVSITIEKSGRHWPMCEYCSHEAAAACIDNDIKKVMERLLRDIWVHTQGQESVSGEWQETFSFLQCCQIQNHSGQCHCFVVIKYAPRVILKPLPIARLWETQKFLDLVRESIKMSGLFCLFLFSERSW